MSPVKKALCLLLLAYPCLIFCQSKTTKSKSNDRVVAVVNGHRIRKSEVFDLLATRYPQQTREITQELILRYIIRQEAKKDKIQISRQEIAEKASQEIKELQKQVAAQKGNWQQYQGNWQQYLKENGTSDKTLLLETRIKWKYILTLQRLVKLSQLRQTRIEARHIVVKEREKAREILQKLKSNADFAALARQHSTAKSTAKEGGKLPILYKGDLPAELEDVLWNLKPRELSEITETPTGFHILQVLEIISGDPGASLGKGSVESITPSDLNRWLREMRKKYKIRQAF